MSHFVVVVVGDDHEEQLAPYNENLETDGETEYLEGTDFDEMKDYYESEEGRELTIDELVGYVERWNGGQDARVEMVNNQKVLTYETTYNPNSKWDWYAVGGRWNGFFKVKEGLVGTLGDESMFRRLAQNRGEEVEEIPDDRADIAYKRDIDFEGMREDARQEANKIFDLFEKVATEAGVSAEGHRTWEELKSGAEFVDEVRETYTNQPLVKAFKESKEFPGYFMTSPADLYAMGREAFVAQESNSEGVPYAILNEGEWIERGQMGWFGMATNEMEKEDWNKQVQEFYDNLPDDVLLTVVDCHI